MKKVIVLGDGAWGSAVATLLAHNGYEVMIWCYHEHIAQEINSSKTNQRYMPDIVLPNTTKATHDIETVLDFATTIFVAIPVTYIRQVLEPVAHLYDAEQTWVILSKGIEQTTLLLPSQILQDLFGNNVNVAIVSGPSFAYELALKQLTALVVAHNNQLQAQKIQHMLDCKYIATTHLVDVVGVQIAGALKNVVTIAIGMLDGAGYGDNVKAFIFTQGLAEIALIAQKLGGIKDTIYGLAGVGDMVLTALGKHSKNLVIGKKLGQGETLEQLKKEYSLFPEGINSIGSVKQLIEKYNLLAPLFTQLYEVVFNNQSIESLLQNIKLSSK